MDLNLSEIKLITANDITLSGNSYSSNMIMQHLIGWNKPSALLTIGHLPWQCTMERKWMLLKVNISKSTTFDDFPLISYGFLGLL